MFELILSVYVSVSHTCIDAGYCWSRSSTLMYIYLLLLLLLFLFVTVLRIAFKSLNRCKTWATFYSCQILQRLLVTYKAINTVSPLLLLLLSLYCWSGANKTKFTFVCFGAWRMTMMMTLTMKFFGKYKFHNDVMGIRFFFFCSCFFSLHAWCFAAAFSIYFFCSFVAYFNLLRLMQGKMWIF